MLGEMQLREDGNGKKCLLMGGCRIYGLREMSRPYFHPSLQKESSDAQGLIQYGGTLREQTKMSVLPSGYDFKLSVRVNLYVKNIINPLSAMVAIWHRIIVSFKEFGTERVHLNFDIPG